MNYRQPDGVVLGYFRGVIIEPSPIQSENGKLSSETKLSGPEVYMRKIRKRPVLKKVSRDSKRTFGSGAVDARAMAADVLGALHLYGMTSSMGGGWRAPVRYLWNGLARTGGTLNELVPLRSIATGKRPTQNTKVADLEPLTPIRWRARIPLG